MPEIGCPLCDTTWRNRWTLARHLVESHAADRKRAQKVAVAVKHRIPFDTGGDTILL